MGLPVKRAIDFGTSLVALLILAPFFIFIALAIKADDRGTIFYRQDRAGQNGEIFRIYKFRTMVEGAEKMGAGYAVVENDRRITRVGKVLRKYSLDELPQLINVLKGEMSIVGPRPTLPYQVERYDSRQIKRLEVKPGITGWAQVNGRNALTWPERIEFDLWYVENKSLWFDSIIIFKTIGVVLGGFGLYRKAGTRDPLSNINDPNFGEDNDRVKD